MRDARGWDLCPKDHNNDDRVFVEVTASRKPIVLVLSAYFGTQWNLKIAEDVDVRQIIIPGYDHQEVVGIPEGVPIETITWFNKDEKLTRIEKQSIELAMQIQSSQNPENKKALLEKLLRQSFDLQTTDFQSRIDGAKKSVALLEKQLENRNQNSDAIIAKRLEALVEENTMAGDAEDPKLAAERFASEGWKLWREQDFSAAIVKFEKAIKLDPSFNAARNGLGWSQVHLQRHKAAAITFRELLADEPKHGGARNGLGMSLMAVDDNAAAKKEFLMDVGDAIAKSGEKQAAKAGMAAWIGLVQSLQKLKQNGLHSRISG